MIGLLVVSDLHFPSDNKNIWNLTMLLHRISIDALVLAGDFSDSASTNTVGKMFRLLRSVYRAPSSRYEGIMNIILHLIG